MKRIVSIVTVICIFSIGFISGCKYNEQIIDKVVSATSSNSKLPNQINQPTIVNASGTIEVAFSPNGHATDAIVNAINKAQKSIDVQAYSFTSAPIAKALLNAQKRGIDLKIILDKSQKTAKYSSYTFFKNNNIPVKIDDSFKIAHSKIMIIDNINIITGSFNFTKSAEHYNAENMLIMRGNRDLASIYIKNFYWRWNSL